MKFKIEDFVDVKSGKRLPQGHTLQNTKTNFPYIRLVDVHNNLVNESNMQYLSEDTYKKISRYIVNTDDICLAIVGNTIGMVFRIDEKWNDANLTENAVRLTNFKEYALPRYIYYYLISHNGKSEILARKVGSAQGKLPIYNIKSIEIPLPKIEVQKKIAHILSTLDDKIELNRKMNQTLEEMASAIFKSWFVDFDPVHAKANCTDETELENIAKELGISKAILDLFPSEFEESELGMIPKGWKIINFKDLVEKYIDNRGKTPPLVENGIPLLEVRTLPNEMLSSEYLTDKCVSDEIYNTWFRSHLETDDILISTVGTIGLTSIVPPNSKFVIAQNVLGIRANEEFILKKFMFYLMKSKFFIDAINARLVTTVQSSIKRKDMETINIIIPDFSTQKEFVKIVTPIMEKMQSNEILNLEKTRDTLLPKLLSGEIDVTDLSLEME